MGKPRYVLLCVALALGLLVTPSPGTAVRAQTGPLPTCSGSLTSTPMQGRYTGPWHSDADYHFAVFNTDLDLTITIDGTLDVTVTPDGRISGVARGTVDAPIHHDGIHDVSSGTGTISGIVQGTVTSDGANITLVQPVIAMEWGTFVPNGYTVPRSITMPNYQFPTNSADCISLHGSISEQNFPTQFVVADGASGLTQAPGIGVATGVWSLSHVQSATFTQLSQQVDSFISSANAVLTGSNGELSSTAFGTSVLQPLKALLASIHQNPDISRCLLDRLNAWVAATVPALRLRAQALGGSPDVPALRHSSDLARFAQALQMDCAVPDDGTLTSVVNAAAGALDRALAARDWPDAALLVRESILAMADPVATTHRFESDLQALLHTSLSAGQRLEVARLAYAVGDEADARAATAPHTRAGAFHLNILPAAGKKHKKRKKVTSRPKPTPTRTPLPTPTPTATATPAPVSLSSVLQSGVTVMQTRTDGGATPTFSWQAVAGATTYLVFVSNSAGTTLAWAWSGPATSVQYGDTALPQLSGSAGETWPAPLTPPGYTWSVLALDAGGGVVGVGLRLPA